MPLAAGSRLGPYEVLSLLGAGGMGEVYRARDPRLGREVAIKVLPGERMADEGRRRRFVQEARAASALNHPNIVTIHEIGSADGVDFIVMELVAGKTLDRAIPKQGLRLGEVLRIAIPMADALARAHAAGIVHRDLKPANVALTADGAVKVLDFGLAKLLQNDLDREAVTEESPTESALSRPGTVAGTAEYMSPEQASGGRVDARSDVFSFGAVLYEMVTGRRAFAGGTLAATLAAVMTEQPQPPGDVVAGVPRELERIIQRCLRKEPQRRFQHMADVKVELQEIREESDPAAAVDGASRDGSAGPRGSRRWTAVAVGLVALTGLAAATAWLSRERPTPLPPPRVEALTAFSGHERSPTFSPDGQQVAFAWGGEKSDNWGVYVKMVGSAEVHRLTTDPAGEANPSWSPDGRQIAFLRSSPGQGATVHLVSPLGGAARRLSTLPVGGSLSWSPDGRWLVAPRRCPSRPSVDDCTLWLLPVGGGEPRLFIPRAPAGADTAPAFSPDGRRLAYASCVSQVPPWPCDVHVVDLDPERLVPVGVPRRLTRQALGIRRLAWTSDGRSIVYDTEPGPWTFHLWRVPATGDAPPERLEIAGLGARDPAIAGTRLAFSRTTRDTDVVRFVEGREPAVVLDSSFEDSDVHFSPDGRRIAFSSMRSGRPEIWLAAPDGSDPSQLTRGPGSWQGSPSWAPDGRRIAFDTRADDGRWGIWTIDVDGGSPRPITRHPGDENVPTWSRDGRWVYFGAERDGTPGVFRVPAEGGDEERLTREPVFYGAQESPDGRALFFKRGWGATPVVAHSLVGGADETLVACVRWTPGFAVAGNSLYYVPCAEGDAVLHRLDLETRRTRVVGKLPGYSGQVGVSADERALLYYRFKGQTADLMLIESFR